MGLRRPLSGLHLLLGLGRYLSSVHSNLLPRSTSRSMGLRSRSEENLYNLNECLDNMDEDVAELFMEYHEMDLREDPELFKLLNDYFTTSKGVSKLCESLKTCLERFVDHDHDCDKDFSSDCDFFARDFLKKTQICHEDLAVMIIELESTMKQIDQKLKRVRGKRAIVTAALLAPLIAAIIVSKAIAGIFGSVPLEPLTTFGISRWKKSTETLKREKIAMTSMERATTVVLKEIEKISILVSRLESVEKSIRVKTEFAVKKRSAVAVAMGGMEKERKRLKSTIVDLDLETGRCDGFAQFGRTVAREKIAEFLSRGQKSSN